MRLFPGTLMLGLLVATPLAAQRVQPRAPLRELLARASRDTCDSRALYELAVGYSSARRYDEADSVLRRAIAIDPQLADGFVGVGLVQERNKRFWERVRHLGGSEAVRAEHERRSAMVRRAFLIDPFVDVRLLGLATRQRAYGAYFRPALLAFFDGDYQTSYRVTSTVFEGMRRRVMTADSIPPDLLWMHALAAARTARHREAITDVETLIRITRSRETNDSLHRSPLHTNEYRYLLAGLYQKLRQNTRAIEQYRRVLADDIGNYMAHVQLARIYESERGWFDAVRERRLAAEVSPEDHTLLADLASTLILADRHAEAEEPLLRAHAMEPRYPRTQRLLGIVEQRLGKRDAARAALERYLAIAPASESDAILDARRRLAELGEPATW